MLRRPTRRNWAALAAAEVVLAAAAVLLDLLLPAIVLLALMTISLLVRREGLASLGLVRVRAGPALAAKMLLFSAAWTLFHLGVLIPVANHVTGERQDLSDFAALEGDLGTLVGLLVLTWTLAAVGEELAFRGYLQTRLTELLGARGLGLVGSVGLSSLLFGMLHTEQGLVGVLLTTIDGIAFCVLRYRFATLWASILAHGFNNTIGFVAFYLVGPVYGLW